MTDGQNGRLFLKSSQNLNIKISDLDTRHPKTATTVRKRAKFVVEIELLDINEPGEITLEFR